jgi:hypothetical protein
MKTNVHDAALQRVVCLILRIKKLSKPIGTGVQGTFLCSLGYFLV